MKLSIEDLEPLKDKAAKAMLQFRQKHKEIQTADLRIEISEGKSASAFNGNLKGSDEDFAAAIGMRCFAKKNGTIAGGFIGRYLGPKQMNNLGKVLEELKNVSLKRAKANAEGKAKLAKKYAKFAAGLHSTELAEVKPYVDTVKARFKKSPRDISLEELSERTEKNSIKAGKINGVVSNALSVYSGLERKVFASTEGALIDQARALTSAFIFVAAKGKALDTYYDSYGNYAGLEVLEGENPHGKSLEDWVKFIAEGTAEVANSPAMKTTSGSETVITDPWMNALISHEITGHPSEADRALKREGAWAGRAWWFDNLKENKFGQKVASEKVSVFSDPTLDGYGKFKYDDEGVLGKKVYHIRKGILEEFLNSRETAKILGKEPNGGMRATDASFMPIIRMNNTCFEQGDWKKEEIFEETKSGYYALGQKTPSIGETRQNFMITCWKLYKIENGELGQLYRSGGVSADSYSFLNSIDAVGNDFRLYNIPNCGKGIPMQVMKVGNGGPHLRGKAIITGSNE